MTAMSAHTAVGPYAQSKPKLPLLAKLAVITMLIPAGFSIGPLAMSPSRLLFLVVLPFLFIKLLRGDYGKILLMDIFVIANIAWMSLAILVNNTPMVVQFTGSMAMVILGGYLTARATIRDAETFAALCRFLGYVIVFSLPFALFESLTQRMLFTELINAIPGLNSLPRTTLEQRIPGLYRAQFTFIHPIHYGFFCALVFALVLSSMKIVASTGERWFLAGAAVFCSFLSLSSAAVLVIAIQFNLIIYARLTHKIKKRWFILISTVTIGYIILDILSNRPALIAIISRVSFNAHTVHFRQHLFELGSAQVAKTPWLGVGFNDWGLPPWMNNSVDNFWLLQALVYGLPAMFFLMGAFVLGTVFVAFRKLQPDSPLRDIRLGWVFMMVGLNLTLATVALFSVMYSMAFFFFGAGMWMIANKVVEPDAAAPVAPPPPGRGSSVYSRFPAKAQAKDQGGPPAPQTAYARAPQSAPEAAPEAPAARGGGRAPYARQGIAPQTSRGLSNKPLPSNKTI